MLLELWNIFCGAYIGKRIPSQRFPTSHRSVSVLCGWFSKLFKLSFWLYVPLLIGLTGLGCEHFAKLRTLSPNPTWTTKLCKFIARRKPTRSLCIHYWVQVRGKVHPSLPAVRSTLEIRIRFFPLWHHSLAFFKTKYRI